MARFIEGPVTVSVPATSANLGPGFDSLGLALALRDELTASVDGGGTAVRVDGAGADDVSRTESNQVVRRIGRAFEQMHAAPTALSLTCRTEIARATSRDRESMYL